MSAMSAADFRNGPGPFEWNDLTVEISYTRDVAPGTVITVSFKSFRAHPPQGLTIFGRDGGKVTVDGRPDVDPARKVRLWSDDREEVTVRYWNPRKGVTLVFVNCFLVQAEGKESAEWWMPYRAMVVQEHGDIVLLRCSGNLDAPNFDDMVVELTFQEA